MISVIIPTYNRANTILRSVNSVLNQTYEDIELLIIDDGSTDNTKKLLEQLGDSRIRYICLDTNSGASNARNVGAKHAKGEWIAFQDSDDAWKPDKLNKQMKYALEHPEYNLIYSSYIAHLADQDIYFPTEPLPSVMEGEMFDVLLLRNVIGAPTMLIEREAFLQSGGFDTAYQSLEDWEFVIRFSKNNLIGYVPDCLMDVYVLDGGISSRVSTYYDSRCRMLAEYKNDILKHGLFDTIVMDILTRANNSSIGEQIQKIMMFYLQTIPVKF